MYAHLLVVVYARGDFAGASSAVQLRFNNDSGANYDYQFGRSIAASSSSGEIFAATSAQISDFPANTAGANLFGVTQMWVPHYAGSTNNKQFDSTYASKTGTTTGLLEIGRFMGGWRSTAAINRITLLPTSGNFVAGTRCTIYGFGA